MTNGFLATKAITDPKDLFGRKELLAQLIALANNRYCVAITGLRRFGKTSILKCIETYLRQDQKSKVYPLYFDFKEVGSCIRGTDNVYRYMISQLIARLSQDMLFEESIPFKKVTINATKDWEDVFEILSDVNAVRIQGLFEEITSFFSEFLEKTILFLIDEYEFLFRFSFDSPVGFMKLRNFSSKTLLNGINPFCFWITGTTSWEYLCSITGSGELNVINAPPIYLGPIDADSFHEMWQNEVNYTTECPDQIITAEEFAFNASGGVPFYGKLIGAYILSERSLPTFSLLKSFFHELHGTFQNEEKDILSELSRLPRNYKSSKFIIELIDKGLIKRNGNNYEVSVGFLKDYINLSINVDDEKTITNMPETEVINDNINVIITNINRTYHNKQGSYIFVPVVDDAALIKDLRTPCYSADRFSDFANSLYKIIYEKTKANKNGDFVSLATLPKSFKRGNQFINAVDIMRHSLGGGHLMDTFIQRNEQMTKPEMLEYLVGCRNEPSTPEDFYFLQVKTLKNFEAELKKLQQIIHSQP